MKSKIFPSIITSVGAMVEKNIELKKKSRLSGMFTITDRWTDSKGNIWTKLTYFVPELNASGYELRKLSRSGKILEGVFSTKNYPTEIDPNAPGYYLSYYHH
jgi:hypothetical protein